MARGSQPAPEVLPAVVRQVQQAERVERVLVCDLEKPHAVLATLESHRPADRGGRCLGVFEYDLDAEPPYLRLAVVEGG